MKRILVGALLGVALLTSPLWARPERGGWRHGDGYRSYGYGGGYGYGYPYRSWYLGPTYAAPRYVAPTYVVPEYPVTPVLPAYRSNPEALVSAWYGRYLGRDMDSGASSWFDELRGGAEPSLLLSQILASDEYYQRGGATPSGFVERLYLDVAGRRPSSSEKDSALGRLAPSGRQGVAYALLQQYPEAVLIR